MADANHNAKLLRQLTALVRGSRTFVHRNRPLYWHEVRHLRRFGLRYLSQVYGYGSPVLEAFDRLTKEAFNSLRLGDDLVIKGDYLPDGAIVLPGDPNQVGRVHKLPLNDALQMLIEAARRARSEICQMPEPAIEEKPPAVPEPEKIGGQNNGADRRTQVDRFIEKLWQAGHKIKRKDIWAVAGYKDRTEFERFQRSDSRTTQAANTNFNRVLRMKPEQFIEALKKGIAAK